MPLAPLAALAIAAVTADAAVIARSESPLHFSDGLALVEEDRGGCCVFHYVDRHGRTVVPEQRGCHPGEFHSGYALVRNSKVGFIDKTGRMALPWQSEWRDVQAFSEHFFAVQLGDRWGFANNRGRLVIPARFDPPAEPETDPDGETRSTWQPLRFSEGLAAVGLDGWVGFIDRAGRFVLEPRFEAAEPFSEGLAAVRLHGRWGFVDHDGRVVVAPRFDLVSGFEGGTGWGVMAKNHYRIYPDGRFVAFF